MNHECVLVSNSWPDTVVVQFVEPLLEGGRRVDVNFKRHRKTGGKY